MLPFMIAYLPVFSGCHVSIRTWCAREDSALASVAGLTCLEVQGISITNYANAKMAFPQLVRERGLEPPPLTGPDPKSGASAISPLAREAGVIYRPSGRLRLNSGHAELGSGEKNAFL